MRSFKGSIHHVEVFMASDNTESIILNQNDYWWITANPRDFKFASLNIGDEITFTSKNDDGNQRQIPRNFQNIKVGDIVIGYQSGIQKIVSIGEVSQKTDQLDFDFKQLELLSQPIEFSDLETIPKLKNMEFKKDSRGTLFKLTKNEFGLIASKIQEKNPNTLLNTLTFDQIEESNLTMDPTEEKNMELYLCFSKEELKEAALNDLQIVSDYDTNLVEHLNNIKRKILLDDNTLISIIAAINSGFNIVLYGPPGTAKTTISEFLPVELYGAKCNTHTADSEWNVRKVIGGITVSYDAKSNPPAERIGPKNGYIVEDIIECYESRLTTRDYDTAFTIIDEFNRTNMDECLGPMFTAMGSNNKNLKLDYNKGFNDDFLEILVPNGYRMICNMNKYDRTFTNELSDALSRRFKWIYIGVPDTAMYSVEENIVEGNVFDDVSRIDPNKPESLKDLPKCERYTFFDNCIIKPIYDVINDLRKDLELGTSYKIDAIKLAWHFFDLKLKTINWSLYPELSEEIVKNSNSVEDVLLIITDTNKRNDFEQLLRQYVLESIDAALVMTVVPACESLEDSEAIENNKNRFAKFSRCTDELSRMRKIF